MHVQCLFCCRAINTNIVKIVNHFIIPVIIAYSPYSFSATLLLQCIAVVSCSIFLFCQPSRVIIYYYILFSKMSNQTIIDFCEINEEYDVLIDYFKTKKIFDFKQFQDNQKDICFYLNESFPTINFSKLRDSIYEFENLQNQSSIDEVDQFVSKKDFDELKENFLKLENYVKNELNKFDNPQVIAASKADGDFFD